MVLCKNGDDVVAVTAAVVVDDDGVDVVWCLLPLLQGVW